METTKQMGKIYDHMNYDMYASSWVPASCYCVHKLAHLVGNSIHESYPSLIEYFTFDSQEERLMTC